MTGKYPKGITKGPKGWRVTIKFRGQLWQKRFKPSTPQDAVEKALSTARRARGAGQATTAPGTFAEDVERYLADYFTGRSGYDERERHLGLWREALGDDTLRADITRDDLARILNRWRAQGLAADTCNKRRTALLALYHALDGKGGSNPVREIPKFRPPDPLPRGLAYDDIERALAKMPRCKTKARLTVMAYTGLRQGQVMKLKPEHWDHRRHVLMVPGTAKGRGTKPYVIPLGKHAQDALVEFDTLEAWGSFTWAPMARLWRQCWYAMTLKVKRTPELEVPASFVSPPPYDLRHSFGTQIFRDTGDLKTTKEMLGHSSLRTTERYMLAAVADKKVQAVKAFEKSVRKGRK